MDSQKHSSVEIDNEEDLLEEEVEQAEETELEAAYEEEEIDDSRLYELCVVASEAESRDDEIWDEIRAWYRNTSVEDRAIAIDQRQQFTLKTPLHEACNHPDPPPDVIARLLACSPDANVAQVVDQSSWIPLHIACNSEVSAEVIQLLVDAYPEGKTLQDQKGRTPLHFLVSKDTQAFKNSLRDNKFFTSFLNKEESPATKNMIQVAKILTTNHDANNSSTSNHPNQQNQHNQSSSDTSAERLRDSINKMLPIHYACAYGIPTSVIKVLVEVFPESIIATDKFGRTPLHYSMRNADNSESPQRVQLLVERDPHTLRPRRNLTRVVDMRDNDGSLPIQQLVAKAAEVEEQNEIGRENITKCLNIYLDTKPLATAKFLTGLQILPKWLKDTAVVNANVKTILNQKIAKRIPTMFLLLDGLFLVAIFVIFSITGQNFIKLYDESTQINNPHECAMMQGGSGREAFSFFLYIGMSYFLIRELLQMLSLYSLGTFKSWISDFSNWVDVLVITLVFFFTVAMDTCMLSKNAFRLGIVITIMTLAIQLISFLKSTLEEFAVFVNGVIYVVKRLGAFIIALFVILVAFSEIFYFIYHLSEECQDADEFPVFAHCTPWHSLLRVFASLMGEVNPSDYSTKNEALFFFALYVFIVIILLSNVLIAVVTDNYGVIKNERAAIVFWSNRLDFVAEMDAISRVHTLITPSYNDGSNPNNNSDQVMERSEEEHLDYIIWNNFMSLFFEKQDMDISQFNYWVIAFYRVVAFFIITPLWIIVGFCSAGWLWPPQVRQKFLVQRVVSNSRSDVSNVISMQISGLRKEVNKLRLEVKAEMKNDRRTITEMKSEAEAVQSDILADMMQIKEVMRTLLVLRRSEMSNRSNT